MHPAQYPSKTNWSVFHVHVNLGSCHVADADSVGLGVALSFCISNKCQVTLAGHAAGTQTTFRAARPDSIALSLIQGLKLCCNKITSSCVPR